MEINIENSLEHFKKLVRRYYKSDLQSVIPLILMELGFPAKLDGNDFVTTAILFYPGTINGTIPINLYEAISQTHGGIFSKSTIEKSIRKAIREAWMRRDETMWLYYFPVLEGCSEKPPTNHEFIAEMARIMVLWKGLCQTHEYELLLQRRVGHGGR